MQIPYRRAPVGRWVWTQNPLSVSDSVSHCSTMPPYSIFDNTWSFGHSLMISLLWGICITTDLWNYSKYWLRQELFGSESWLNAFTPRPKNRNILYIYKYTIHHSEDFCQLGLRCWINKGSRSWVLPGAILLNAAMILYVVFWIEYTKSCHYGHYIRNPISNVKEAAWS